MRALLDVNCLLSLMDEDHVHHGRAVAGWRDNGWSGWASCPHTQTGFVRISSQRSHPNPQPFPMALARLGRQIEDSDHEFWADDISITDGTVFDPTYFLGPKQITDIYLLGLAVKHAGRLVTFDRGVPLKAVRRAEPRHLAVV